MTGPTRDIANHQHLAALCPEIRGVTSISLQTRRTQTTRAPFATRASGYYATARLPRETGRRGEDRKVHPGSFHLRLPKAIESWRSLLSLAHRQRIMCRNHDLGQKEPFASQTTWSGMAEKCEYANNRTGLYSVYMVAVTLS